MTWKDLKLKQASERRKYLTALMKKSKSTAEAARVAGVSRPNFYDLLHRADLM